MAAWLRVIPLAMRINGHGLSFGGVGPVVTLPQHRRKGYVGALLRRALADMRDRGQVLAGLHTPHPALYRRYGWEIASERRVYTFAPKDISLLADPKTRGRTRMLRPDDWPQADRVYRLHSAKRNGPLHRGEVWWKEAIFGGGQPQAGDVALWETDEGEPEGYIVYHQKRGYDEFMPQFWIRELVAVSTDAYINLIHYVLRHDLPSQITFSAPPYDPFMSLVQDNRRVKIEHEYDMMLRICDVEGALRMRSIAHAGHDVSLTLGIEDDAAPWNSGVFRLELAGNAVNVERTEAAADMRVSATTLAPLFNGYLSPRDAVLTGLATVLDEHALAAAEELFATLYQPYCSDGF
jgi:predicted acetyltransferase